MQPILFRLPIGQEGIPVYGFGLMLFLTFLATTWMACRRAERIGIAREVIQDLAVWLFLGGIIGARVTYLIFHAGMRNPLEILAALPRIWDGGIILYGSVLGALAAYGLGYWLVFRHKKNVTTLRLADVVAPTIALGLILGRLGCLLNGCCYGQVACPSCPSVSFPLSAPAMSDLVHAGHQTALGFLLEDDSREARVSHVQPGSAAALSGLEPGDVITRIQLGPGAPGTPEGAKPPPVTVKGAQDVTAALAAGLDRDQRVQVDLTVQREGKKLDLTFRPQTLGLHPTQLYESISMALLLLLLLAFEPFKRSDGQVMALMMIGYAVHRYVNEILRIDQRPEGFEKYVSVLLLASGVILMAWSLTQRRKDAKEKREAVE